MENLYLFLTAHCRGLYALGRGVFQMAILVAVVTAATTLFSVPRVFVAALSTVPPAPALPWYVPHGAGGFVLAAVLACLGVYAIVLAKTLAQMTGTSLRGL